MKVFNNITKIVICTALECDIADIMEIENDTPAEE